MGGLLAGSPHLQLRHHALEASFIEYPSTGAAYIRANHPEARIFNTYDWGGFLINALHPQKVFIDGRSDFYDDSFLRAYRRVEEAEPDWQAVLDEHGVQLAIVPHSSRIAGLMEASPGRWRRIFSGPVEAIFLRVDGETQ